MFSEIYELKSIRQQKSRLSERESELSTPKLIDVKLIPLIHRYFYEFCGMAETRKKAMEQRKKFIFIITFLYSPSVLAGGQLSIGLRDELANLLKLRASSSVSHAMSDIWFLYQQYKPFRQDVDKIYCQIEAKLTQEGFIK